MRLSLRTLLAFGDNVFDVEQHRRIKAQIQQQKDACQTLQRIESVLRQGSIPVPGLIDGQEELDPNYVAEYLDHQMTSEVQERFETYCLGGDKYLAEVAAVHNLLSNVLVEPARTSGECRLKCYAMRKNEPQTVPEHCAAADNPSTSKVRVFNGDEMTSGTVLTRVPSIAASQKILKFLFPFLAKAGVVLFIAGTVLLFLRSSDTGKTIPPQAAVPDDTQQSVTADNRQQVQQEDDADPFLVQAFPQDNNIGFEAASMKPNIQLKPPQTIQDRSAVLAALPQSAWEIKPMPIPVKPAPVHPAIVQTAAIEPAMDTDTSQLGTVLSDGETNILFSAINSDTPWTLAAAPSELKAAQYLLTVVPFNAVLELRSAYRFTMVGDVKLSILPPDKNGTTGIYVDYGRIVIKPLKANQPLRIETEKVKSVVSVTGTKSILFIDTFAENGNTSAAMKPMITPILGFVANGETLLYKTAEEKDDYMVSKQGGLLLADNHYRFGEMQHLPAWLQLPLPADEDKGAAQRLRQLFSTCKGNSEAVLNQLLKEESVVLRALGYRLWGDLGRFDVPFAVKNSQNTKDEAIRSMMNVYFTEVLKRDSDTVQRYHESKKDRVPE